MLTIGQVKVASKTNRTFMPEGKHSFDIVGYREEEHHHFGYVQGVLMVRTPWGGEDAPTYDIEIPLGPSGDMDAFAAVLWKNLVAFGVEPQVVTALKAAGADLTDVSIDPTWAADLSAYLKTLPNNASIEVRSKHVPQDKKRDDGTPYVNCKVYINRVITNMDAMRSVGNAMLLEPQAAYGAPVPAGFLSQQIDDGIPF